MKHKQNKTIYLFTGVNDLGKPFKLENDISGTYDTAKEAIEAAKKEVEGYSPRAYVYECRPVFRIDKAESKVTKL